jgi:hypothetical protein
MATVIKLKIEESLNDSPADYLHSVVTEMRSQLVIECVKIARRLCEMDKQVSDKNMRDTIDKLDSVCLALIREDEDPYSPMHSVIKYLKNKHEAKKKIEEMEKDLREIEKELAENKQG